MKWDQYMIAVYSEKKERNFAGRAVSLLRVLKWNRPHKKSVYLYMGTYFTALKPFLFLDG
jgi:hypothetical protein